MAKGLTQGCLFIDTGIKLEQTLQYVIETCKKFNWTLKISKTPANYDDLVMKYGFPGPSFHTPFFAYLKQRAIRVFMKEFPKGTHFRFYTGVRTGESKRRFGTAKPQTKGEGKSVLVAPIIDWSTEKVWQYIRENNLPINEAYQTLHFSGDCLCGAFADPSEASLILAFYPEVAQRIRELERKRAAVTTVRCAWGHGTGGPGVTNASEAMVCGECKPSFEKELD